MDIKDIVKNAPEGATHYKAFSMMGATYYNEYYKLVNGRAYHYDGRRGWRDSHSMKNFQASTPLPTRTKVEYVEIPRESVDIELIDEVFIDDAGEVSVRDASTAEFFTCSLYRRIETQITEREEFEIKFNDIRDRWDSSCDDFITLADFLYSNDCRFVGE